MKILVYPGGSMKLKKGYITVSLSMSISWMANFHNLYFHRENGGIKWKSFLHNILNPQPFLAIIHPDCRGVWTSLSLVLFCGRGVEIAVVIRPGRPFLINARNKVKWIVCGGMNIQRDWGAIAWRRYPCCCGVVWWVYVRRTICIF